MSIASFRTKAVSLRHTFQSDDRGNVAMMFGLAILPMLVFAGAGLDYTRAQTERERLQAALDATGLALAKLPKTTDAATLQTKANEYFAASFLPRATDATPTITATATNNGSRISLVAQSAVATSFMRLAGWNALPIGVDGEVVNEKKKIELALVLDNTGSMGWSGKMPALKVAVNDLIDQLKAKVVDPDDVKLSLVPFASSVRVSTDYFNASWLRWDVTLENGSLGWSQRTPPTPTSWTGCIADRDQPWDTRSEPAGIYDSRYVAAKCASSSLARLEPLTNDLELIRTLANAMTPNGMTNVTIGLTMGMATLRNDSPFGLSAGSGPDVEKFLILLTDGDNTQNRWTNAQGSIDARLSAACTTAKTAGVKIYTIRVIEGNASLLQSCATNPSMYYDVQNASELQPVFKKILESIQGIRLAS